MHTRARHGTGTGRRRYGVASAGRLERRAPARGNL